ncbi:hypothetical protein HY571_00325 [Candidatus Micrarchaeota archaeon]|nr:hypothetical protein [Candidatus Micrarchaeota archaeon]
MVLKPGSLSSVLWHTFDSYSRNFSLLLLFSVPFLVVFPLALLLPSFSSLGGIFLRFGSISRDVALLDVFIIAIAFCLSLLLFSFGLVAINMIIKTERTLKTLPIYEFQKVELYTFRLFLVFFVAFLLSLGANVFLYEFGLHSTVGAFISLLFALLVVFAPQVVVVDDQKPRHVPAMSLKIIRNKFSLFLSYLVIGLVLVLLLGFVLTSFSSSLGHPETPHLIAAVVNALFLVPFLEVLKTQVYLSKYSLL